MLQWLRLALFVISNNNLHHIVLSLSIMYNSIFKHPFACSRWDVFVSAVEMFNKSRIITPLFFTCSACVLIQYIHTYIHFIYIHRSCCFLFLNNHILFTQCHMSIAHIITWKSTWSCMKCMCYFHKSSLQQSNLRKYHRNCQVC